MKKIKFLFVASLLSFVVVTACKKKEEPEPKTTLEYLTGTGSRSWKVTKGTIRQGTTDVDLLSAQNPCNSDNILVLISDKTYEFREGATKCELNAPDLILQGSWVLTETESEKSLSVERFIFLDRIIQNPKLILSSVSDDSFTGNTEISFNGSTYQGTLTFSRVQ